MISIEHAIRLVLNISPEPVALSIKKIAGSKSIHSFLRTVERRRLNKINKLENVLVIPDINIGDAIILQSFLSNLKKCFPDIKINYAYQSKSFPLIKANPEIKNHYPIFKSTGFPSEEDLENLKNIVESNDYDLIFNFCPYFSRNTFRSAKAPVIYPIRLIAEIIRAYSSHNQKAQITFRLNKFSVGLLKKIDSDKELNNRPARDLSKGQLFLTEQVYLKTIKVMDKLSIYPDKANILYNPDSSSRYTLVPHSIQVRLLKGILSLKKLDHLLMNCGFTFKGIEKKLLAEIPSHLRKKITIIPRDTEIDIYTGLVDNVRILITGDTAPIHIAAAKKYILDSNNSFNNSTAIIGIFGATSAKIYGYDSYLPDYVASAQSAPSKIFEGDPPCKNITCINKIFKRCPKVRCFEGVDPDEIVDYVRDYLT